MTDVAFSATNLLVIVLRFAVVVFLYFFLWQVMRALIKDLRSANKVTMIAGNNSSMYGEIVVQRAGQSGVAVGKSFPLGPSNILGRSMDLCEIALNDSFLSSQHARLELQGDDWVVEDLRSTNGTFVNDIEVRGPTIIEDGDIIRIGRVEMKLVRP